MTSAKMNSLDTLSAESVDVNSDQLASPVMNKAYAHVKQDLKSLNAGVNILTKKP